MPDFTFRIRFQLSPHERLMADATEWHFALPASPRQVRMTSRDERQPIQDANEFVAVSSEWTSQAEAQHAGERFQTAMTVALTSTGIGVDFGRRMAQGWFVTTALAEMSQRAGRPVLNDAPGLMVYETEPAPQLVGVLGTGYSGSGIAMFERALSVEVANPRSLSDRERLSLELLNASFFEGSSETQFLPLVMAVEALLQPRPKSDAGREHVESLITLTETAATLSPDEKASLLSTLGWLKTESIGQAGRRLARERLGDRPYGGMTAPKFFTHCYTLRSRLVHGAVPAPTGHELGGVLHDLRKFVSDLLAAHA